MEERQKLSLRTHRQIAGLTVEQASEKIGISAKSLYSWETDTEKLRSARFDSVIRLCELYGITINEVLY